MALMKILLDTHTFIWMDKDVAKLSPNAKSLIADRRNQLLLSVASIWEMRIKATLGKLQLRLPLAQIVSENQSLNGLVVIDIRPDHIYALEQLPAVHNDPFDRLIASVALYENIPLLTADSVFHKYPIRSIW
jgi:PIN domain nuclease of toxin-antitoxin system